MMNDTQIRSSVRQLTTVVKVENDREQKAMKAYTMAQQYLSQQQQKLHSLEQYRVSYIQQIKHNASAGVTAQHYHQHLSFVGKLDKACEQQTQIISQASGVALQRKRQWLQQQQRLKAVELLIDKRQAMLLAREAKVEQKMNDEFALRHYMAKRPF
jgi:flagellar FliJ protein